MTWTDYDIVGSYNNQRYPNIDAERTINMFEYLDATGKKQKTLISTSGLVDEKVSYPSAGSTDGFRSEFVFGSSLYSVIGNHVYKQDSALTPTLIGTISNNTGYVGIDANTFQVIFVNGADGYIYDTNANTFVEITDPAFPATPIDVTYLDGFFVVANGNTNKFQLSSFNQGLIWGIGTNTIAWTNGSANLVLTGVVTNYPVGTLVTFSGGTVPTPLVGGTTYYVKTVTISTNTTITVSATVGGSAISITQAGSGTTTINNNGQLQEGQITSHPGTIVACRTLHRRLFLFSQNYTEVWENAGLGTNLPFRRNNSLLMEYGTPAIGSVEVGFDMMFFLSQDQDGLGSVMQVLGTQAIPVSNRALDFQLAQYASEGEVDDAYGVLVKENGIIFYRLNFTDANHTYVYNISMSDPTSEQGRRWHEEQTLNDNRHPGQTHSYFNGNNYYGSYNSPVLYLVDPNEVTNAGEAIPRVRIGKSMTPPDYKRTRIDRFHLDVIQGQVDDIPHNVAPTIFLSYSKNGGQTFGNRLPGNMGKIGEYSFRTVWRKLGVVPRGQGFVPKVEFFNEVPFTVLGAAWVFEVMPE